MGAITYTALREFEPTGFSVTGTDISAAASDDSFNASSTVLTGLLTDEWALVSGFASSSNNGWFQIKSNSTSTKILELTAPITHLRLPAVSGNYASTPDSVANSIVSDITIKVKAALTDWTPAGVQTLVAKWNTTGNQRAYALSVNAAGTLNYSWSVDGTAVTSKDSTVATSITDLASKWIKVTHDVNNGAAGNDVKFWLSDDNVTYTQLGTTVTTGGVTSIQNTTALLEVGSINSGTSQLLNGRVYYAHVAAGLDTAAVAVFDPSTSTRNAVSIVATTGETWTINTSGTPPAMLQGSALVTVAASPSISIVGYRRGLNQSYTLEFYSERVDRSVQVKRSVQQPMGGGAPEVLTYRRETFIDVTVLGPLGALLTEVQILQWREFLASVEGGETFTFDRYGTVAVPVEPETAILESTNYTEERVAGVSNTGLYKLSFKVRLLT